MDIERSRSASVRRFDETSAIDIHYGSAFIDPSWQVQPVPVRDVLLRSLAEHEMDLASSWAEIVWPDVVRRRPDGSAYRQRTGWCVAEQGLLLLDARQEGHLQQRRFRPDGAWETATTFRTPHGAQLRHVVQQPRRSGGAAGVTHGSAAAGYDGDHPEIWTTLPAVICAGMQHYIADRAMQHELAHAQIVWGDAGVTERVWYERRNERRATAVAMQRGCSWQPAVATADAAADAVRLLPWTVTAWRSDVAAAREHIGGRTGTLPHSVR